MKHVTQIKKVKTQLDLEEIPELASRLHGGSMTAYRVKNPPSPGYMIFKLEIYHHNDLVRGNNYISFHSVEKCKSGEWLSYQSFAAYEHSNDEFEPSTLVVHVIPRLANP